MANEILQLVRQDSGSVEGNGGGGGVVVLCGLSGTGKVRIYRWCDAVSINIASTSV